MARKLRFFKEQMFKAGVSPKGSTTQSDVNIDDLEIKLSEIESELTEMNANGEKLQRTYNELVEYKLVLQKAGDFFHSAQSRAIEQQREYESRHLSGDSMEVPLLQDQVDILPAHI